ncbi:MAG: hypothetical protein ACI4BD_08085 [Paludibacteraceae bacterium]
MNISCQIHTALRLLQVLWFVFVLCAGTGCTGWHEAQMVVQKADSLDTHGIIYQDTAALLRVIRMWERPVLRVLKHDDLGKAYYYLGRNKEDRYQQYVEAAECYVRSDQLHMSDPIRRGRVNSCMGYVCGKAGVAPLSLEFAQRALHDFKQSKNDTYIASGLLYIMQIYGEMSEYSRADSIYSLLAQYELDSINLLYLNMYRGWCYYGKKDYNSAMISFQNAIQFACNNDTERWRIYQEIMKTYYRLGNLDSAVSYAENIIRGTSYPVLCANAYYILIDDATNRHDAQAVSYYAHKRADMQQLDKKTDKDYSRAVSTLENYLDNTSSILSTVVKISLSAFLLTVCILVGIWSWRKYHKRFLDTQQHAIVLEEQLANVNKELEETQQAQRREVVETVLLKCCDAFAFESDIWNDDDLLCKTADRQLDNIYTRLHTQFSIDIQDLKICILTLYNASRAQIATNIFRAVSSVPKLRTNTAKKLGTTSTNLRTFLLDFLAS